MPSINDILRYGESFLKDTTRDYLIDAKLLLEHVLDESSIYIFMHREDVMDLEKEKLYKSLLERRKTGEPLQYIVGHQSFMGLDFDVKSGVLIPRSDTEVLVEKVIEKNQQDYPRILDIGAGSGAIHISLAHYIKGAQLVAVDISKDAIEIARHNAKKLEVYDRIDYIESDVFENVSGIFDIIVSNPPYIPSEVIDGLQKELFHEPRIALDGGNDGYDFYRRIIDEGRSYLKIDGLMAFEVGHDQSDIVQKLFEEAGFYSIEIFSDLSGIRRVVMARLEGR